MLVILALIPILVVGFLMLGLLWPSAKAMPVGFFLTVLIAMLAWDASEMGYSRGYLRNYQRH